MEALADYRDEMPLRVLERPGVIDALKLEEIGGRLIIGPKYPGTARYGRYLRR